MAGTDDAAPTDKDHRENEHPPETAVDFEHTLRRLLAERDKARETKAVEFK